jgi:hypothetical protein
MAGGCGGTKAERTGWGNRTRKEVVVRETNGSGGRLYSGDDPGKEGKQVGVRLVSGPQQKYVQYTRITQRRERRKNYFHV